MVAFTRWSVLAAVTALVVAACGASAPPSGSASSSAPSVAPSVGTIPSSAAATANPTPTAKPTPTSKPAAPPRPTDLPTDGTCEEGHTCLGLLGPGLHRAAVFQPPFAFSTTTAGWESLSEDAVSFDLRSLDHPGDMIIFFRSPRATKADGTLDNIGKATVASLTSWLAANPDVQSTPAKPVTIGGLKGMTMDVTVSPTAHHPVGDCPTETCIGLFQGTDRATWAWDWGLANGEQMRASLLDGGDDVVLIVVDSLDGTTFDALTKEADAILGSVRFDR